MTKEEKKKYYLMLDEKGLCHACGKRAAVPGTVTCSTCAERYKIVRGIKGHLNKFPRWQEPVFDIENIRECIKDLNVGDFIKIPTGKINNSCNPGGSINLAKTRAEVVGITDRLIIVRLPNGILDSVTIKEYAIERRGNEKTD